MNAVTELSPKELVLGFVDILQSGRVDLVDALFDPAFRSVTRPLVGDDDTREGLVRDILALRQAIPDAEFTAEEVIAQREKVYLRWRMVGTHLGRLLGVEPSGARVSHYGQELFTVARGRIVARIGQEDRLELEHKLREEAERAPSAAPTR
ncbi:MAG TPA: ester cyclase [Gemmatimonadaceae bacterium]|nr:ester cyclase [Gemmatimonadaceae bacterium]